jgi:hypothetical protein
MSVKTGAVPVELVSLPHYRPRHLLHKTTIVPWGWRSQPVALEGSKLAAGYQQKAIDGPLLQRVAASRKNYQS